MTAKRASTKIPQPFTNLQLLLIQNFSKNIPDESLLEIQQLLVDYFANKASDLADKFWDEKGITDEMVAKRHFRTPYKPTAK
jgi:hypothetical protein